MILLWELYMKGNITFLTAISRIFVTFRTTSLFWLFLDFMIHSIITGVNIVFLRRSFQFGPNYHWSSDNGMPHSDETPKDLLALDRKFYAAAKHFVELIRSRTTKGLSTTSCHELMLYICQYFHPLWLLFPYICYILLSCLAGALGSSFYVFVNSDWQGTADWRQPQMMQQWQHCYHSASILTLPSVL